MRSWRIHALFISLFGLAVICHGLSLREAWEGVKGKCGTLTEKNGVYEFNLDNNHPSDGKHCIISVGSDVLTFSSNASETHKIYTTVPMGQAVLRTLL
jgi:hypothetical protein